MTETTLATILGNGVNFFCVPSKSNDPEEIDGLDRFIDILPGVKGLNVCLGNPNSEDEDTSIMALVAGSNGMLEWVDITEVPLAPEKNKVVSLLKDS